MNFIIIAEIQIINHIDALAEENAILHIIIGIGKGGLNDGFFDWSVSGHSNALNLDCTILTLDICSFQNRKEGIVDKVQQGIPRHDRTGLIIVSPIRPATGLRDNRAIITIIHFPVLFLGVIYLQKQHPRNLLNTLGIAVNAGIVPHNIPQPFYKS
jgi:hypothetical protein